MTRRNRNAKAVTLSLLPVLLAGCAASKLPVNKQDRFGLAPIEDARMANAPIADPPNILPRTHMAAGRLFERQGMLARAIAQYRKAIAVNHDYPVAYHRLGLALSRANRHEAALAALRKAVALSPEDAVLHNDLGFELMYPNEWSEAESHLRKAIELNPALTRAYVNLGLALSKQGRFDEALVAFRDVLPEADAYYNLGLMYRAHQRYKDAEAAFTHALAVAPGFNAARAQLDKLAARSDAGQGPALAQSTPEAQPLSAPEAAVDALPVERVAKAPQRQTADASGTPEKTTKLVAPRVNVEPATQAPSTAKVQDILADARAERPDVAADAATVDATTDVTDMASAYATESVGPESVDDTEAREVDVERNRPADSWSAWRERWNALADDLAWVRDEIACLDAVDVEYDPLAEADEALYSTLDVASDREPLLVSDPLEKTDAEPASPQSDARRHKWNFSPRESRRVGREDVLDQVFGELQDLVALARNEIRLTEAGQKEERLVGPPAPSRETRRYGSDELVNLPPRPADLRPLPR